MTAVKTKGDIRPAVAELISANNQTTIEFLFSSLGNWVIYVNDKYYDSGKIDARYVLNGLSNKCWFEGSLHIYNLSISEQYSTENTDVATGLSEANLEVLDEALAHAMSRYTGFYNTNGPRNRLALLDWEYQNHERTYTRRMPFKSDEGEYTAYRVNLIVTGSHEGNQSISIPLQYEVAIDESDKSLQSINLFFNEKNNRFILVEEDIKKLLPDYLTEGKVVLNNGTSGR